MITLVLVHRTVRRTIHRIAHRTIQRTVHRTVHHTIPYVCHTIHRIVEQTNATEIVPILHYLFELTLQVGFVINDNAAAGR